MGGRDEAGGVDPVALTLVLWLGLVVGAAGLTRLSQQASAQEALDEAAGKPSLMSTMDVPWTTAQALAFGG